MENESIAQSMEQSGFLRSTAGKPKNKMEHLYTLQDSPINSDVQNGASQQKKFTISSSVSGQVGQPELPPANSKDGDDDDDDNVSGDDQPLHQQLRPDPPTISKDLLTYTKIKKEMIEEKQKISQHKVTLFGERCVGKSSLLEYLVHDEAPERPSKAAGVNSDEMYFKDKASNLFGRIKIWDSGHGADHNLISETTNVYMKCEVAVVVFDVTNPDTLNWASMWIDTVQRNVKDFPTKFILVANKCDLCIGINENIAKGRKFANVKDMPFYETSTKDGQEIDDLFNMIVKKALEVNREVQLQEDKARQERQQQEEAERQQREEAERQQQGEAERLPQEEAEEVQDVAEVPANGQRRRKRCIIA